MIVWNLTANITYTDGSWEPAALYKNEKGDFIQIGPDISTLPIVRDFMEKIGLYLRSGDFYRADIKEATYSFSATATNNTGTYVLGATDLIDLITNDFSAIENELLNDPEFINDLAADFRSVWDTRLLSTGSTGDSQIKLPLDVDGTYDFSVDWGDGTSNIISSYDSPDATHTYSVPGEYEISIKGTCNGWRFNNTGDRLKLLEVKTFGPKFGFGDKRSYLYGCSNLFELGPDLRNIINLYAAFRNCSKLQGLNLVNWNITGCTSLNQCFYGTTIFNADISNWDTSQVGSLGYTFHTARAFNQPIGKWDVSNVGSMFYTFRDADAFNSDISNWNTSRMSNTYNMFYGANVFNQDLSRWTVKSATSMGTMFAGSALSVENYSRLLIGWANDVYSRGGSPPNIGFGGNKAYNNVVYGGTPFDNAVDARAYLVSVGWTITDLGLTS